MTPSNLALGALGVLLTASAALHGCSSSSGGGSTFPSGMSGGTGSGGSGSSTGGYASSGINLSSSTSGSSGSNGAGSSGTAAGSGGGGTTSTSSGSQPYVCPGCMDLSGNCRDGGEDMACGQGSASGGSPHCVDCTGLASTPVCQAGTCVSGPGGSSSSGAMGGVDAGGG